MNRAFGTGGTPLSGPSYTHCGNARWNCSENLLHNNENMLNTNELYT